MLPTRASMTFLTLLQITSTAWRWSKAERCYTVLPGWAALPPSASPTWWSTTPCRCWTPTRGPSPAAPPSGPTTAFGSSLSIMNSSCLARTLFTWSVPQWGWFLMSMRKKSVWWRWWESFRTAPNFCFRSCTNLDWGEHWTFIDKETRNPFLHGQAKRGEGGGWSSYLSVLIFKG